MPKLGQLEPLTQKLEIVRSKKRKMPLCEYENSTGMGWRESEEWSGFYRGFVWLKEEEVSESPRKLPFDIYL